MSGVKNIFGGGAFWDRTQTFGDGEGVEEVFEVLLNNDVHTLDTARIYNDSEAILGEHDAGKRFTVDTKVPGGFQPGGGASKALLEAFEISRGLLKHNVDVLYIHAPDKDTPLEETLAAINEAYKSGFFKRFGLSNFTAEQVEQAYNIAKEKGYPLPEVYQGNYSAVARKQETLLFPTLRKLGISFNAYSPIAGGFLTKTPEDLEKGSGRFVKGTFLGDMYHSMYNKPTLVEALKEWDQIAKDEGTTKVALAYRWVKYNSALKGEHGDGVIFGASSIEQIKETTAALAAGPLSEKAAARIDTIWPKIENDAPLDNYHR